MNIHLFLRMWTINTKLWLFSFPLWWTLLMPLQISQAFRFITLWLSVSCLGRQWIHNSVASEHLLISGGSAFCSCRDWSQFPDAFDFHSDVQVGYGTWGCCGKLSVACICSTWYRCHSLTCNWCYCLALLMSMSSLCQKHLKLLTGLTAHLAMSSATAFPNLSFK